MQGTIDYTILAEFFNKAEIFLNGEKIQIKSWDYKEPTKYNKNTGLKTTKIEIPNGAYKIYIDNSEM